MYTKTQRLKLLSIVREDDDEDEVDDQSEEINDANEPEPPRKKKGKLSDFIADVEKDKSRKRCTKLECIVEEIDRYKSEETIESHLSGGKSKNASNP